MGNYKNEQKVFEQYLLCQDLKRVCTTSSTNSFEGYEGDYRYTRLIHGVSTAQRIFATQMIAIGRGYGWYGSVNKERVSALLLLGGIIESEELCPEITDSIIDNIFLENNWKWGNDLFEEYLAGKSPEAIYARYCMDVERFWSGRFPTRPRDWDEMLGCGSPYFSQRVLRNAIEKPRAGWLVWHVGGDADTIADHTVMTQLLAIIMKKIYRYADVNLDRALMMINLHDLVAASVKDVPISKDPGARLSLDAKSAAFSELMTHLSWGGIQVKRIKDLYDEAQVGKSFDAEFAVHAGRCETSLQMKIYDEAGRVDPESAEGGTILQNLLAVGFRISEAWILYDQKTVNYDENFIRVTDYARRTTFQPQ